MTPPLIEACVTTLAEAILARDSGADRIELCRELETGGLTPSAELLAQVAGETGMPVHAMIRTTPEGFRARTVEIDRMALEIEALARAGATGLVFGVLNRNDSIDRPALRLLVAAAGSLPVTFHRAFDLVEDRNSAIRMLAEEGVARVLSSGGHSTAWIGRKVIGELVRTAGTRIVIMAGGSVRADHVHALVLETGVRELHARVSAIPAIVQSFNQRP